jgi:hypothetical protein
VSLISEFTEPSKEETIQTTVGQEGRTLTFKGHGWEVGVE